MTHQHPQNPDGFTVEWFDDRHTILIYRMFGKWKTADFWTAIRTGRDMIEDIDYDVYSIFRIEGKLHIPQGFLLAIGNLPRGNPANIKLNIAVGADPLINTIYRILKPIIPRILGAMILVDNFDAALAVIERHTQETAS